MDSLAISSRGLGKRYRLGAREVRKGSLREAITESFFRPIRRLRTLLRSHSTILSDESIWALRDVTFDVRVGEVVGVIGENGAGKTTLLKLLSRISDPTEGRAELYGRVASLLEVGTGFHPDLTGRENVYLNGSILGMRRDEIDRKFDDIVAFAGVERFIDTQVKHYSSGMYLRLAFAVAAHLDPEILLIDEVLAVGDAAFQRKCLGKMGEVAQSGRTVLFVSHNMEMIQRLCPRTIWVEGGRITRDGATDGVVAEYLAKWAEHSQPAYEGPEASDRRAFLRSARIRGADGAPSGRLRFGEPFAVEMLWRHQQSIPGAQYFLRVFDNRERLIFTTNTAHVQPVLTGAGECEAICRIPTNVLVPGEYSVTLGCYVRPKTMVERVDRGLGFTVIEVPYNDEVMHINEGSIVALPAYWQLGRSSVA